MKQTVYKLLSVLIFTGSVACGWLWMDFKGFMDSRINVPEVGIDITVADGATYASISNQLISSKILHSKLYLKIAGKIYPELTLLKKGEYQIKYGTTVRGLFEKLISGSVKIYQIRFIEGWTLNDFLLEISRNRTLRQDIDKFKNYQIAELLGIEQTNPEGWLYPDTFNFQKGTSVQQILKVSHNKMKETLDKYWYERDADLPYNSAYEVLIMASIIEKETGLSGERDRIAGVFIRRLQLNMRLQTDPTVIYGMGLAFDGNLRSKDLTDDTVYNTYRRKGLPPTPIAMPSEASIKAAVHPAEGTELYFVAKGDGSHYFSSTLEEHNQAVRRYQLNKLDK